MAAYKKKFKPTTDSKHSLRVAKNALKRNFAPSTPRLSWAENNAYFWTREEWLYLAFAFSAPYDLIKTITQKHLSIVGDHKAKWW